MTSLLINHLWQSSCFGLLAAVLAFTLRKHQPKIRFWVWASASWKFLLPFALLANLGSAVKLPAHRAAGLSIPTFAGTVVEIAEPFRLPPGLSTPVPNGAPARTVAIGAIWILGFLAISLRRLRAWLRLRAAIRSSEPVSLPIPIRAYLAPGLEEPGVAGLLRPRLLVPPQLLAQLNPRELSAILAHELCHVRRRDNLCAAIHMLAEAIFWFHPLVWWIGARMLAERERACDEEVLRQGCAPADYVGGILKVCRLSTGPALPCVAGVTGADVKQRLSAVLSGEVSRQLSRTKKVLLAAVATSAIAAPIMAGAFKAPRAQSQPLPLPALIKPLATQIAAAPVPPQPATPNLAFTSATVVKLDQPRSGFPGMLDSHFAWAGMIADLIQWAYEIPRDFQIVESPAWFGVRNFQNGEWAGTEFYEINATLARPANEAELRQMVQKLLADRFKLSVHREVRQIPIYAIVVGQDGPRLPPPTQPEPCPPVVTHGGCGFPNIGGPEGGQHFIMAHAATMGDFAALLDNNVDRPVIDKTGLTDGYTFDLPYEHSGPGWRTGPAILPAIQALGLRLEPQTENMQVLVIDSVNRPAE